MRVVPVPGRARDRVTEFLAGIVFNGKHAVDVAAEAQRADHVVRRSDQVILAQCLEPLVLLARLPGCLVPVRRESRSVELADDLDAAGLLLVRVDHVAAGQPEGAERRPRLAHLHEIADDLAEKVVQRIITRDVTDISSRSSEGLPFPLARLRASSPLPGIRRALTVLEAPTLALIQNWGIPVARLPGTRPVRLVRVACTRE